MAALPHIAALALELVAGCRVALQALQQRWQCTCVLKALEGCKGVLLLIASAWQSTQEAVAPDL
jgi:hypothetical protein